MPFAPASGSGSNGKKVSPLNPRGSLEYLNVYFGVYFFTLRGRAESTVMNNFIWERRDYL